MPSKIQLDENLWFLYICLQQSDYKSIDFNAVGEATNLKPPAARMRYTRLRRQIEGGTLIGTHGMPFSGGAEKIMQGKRKRKRSVIRVEKLKADSTIFSRSILDKTIKTEQKESSDEYEAASLDDSDSEDEIPLAKRRTGQIISTHFSGLLTANYERTPNQQQLVNQTLSYEPGKSSTNEGELGYTRGSYDTPSHYALKSFNDITNGAPKSENIYGPPQGTLHTTYALQPRRNKRPL